MIENAEKAYERACLTATDINVIADTMEQIIKLDHVGSGSAIEVVSEDNEYPIGHWVLLDDFWGFITYDSNAGDTSKLE